MADPPSLGRNVQPTVAPESKKPAKLPGLYQNSSGNKLKSLSLAKDKVNQASIKITTTMN